ncbi:MAG: YciI family protein [Candidatus Limnocylindrales bacterium]
MQYLLLIYQAEAAAGSAADDAEMAGELAAYGEFTREARERNLFIAGEALEPTSTATTLQIREGRTVVTDGPFAETKEALGGFYLLECRDLDEAIEMAAKIPAATRGTIEIRPIWMLPEAYSMARGGDA